MAKRPVFFLTVLSKEWITPSMRRVVLTGPSLSEFPEGQNGCYVKLLLPKPGTAQPGSDDPDDVDLAGYWKRSYTIRRVDQKRLLLVLEVAHHDPGGPAASWASDVAIGDQVLVTGPGPVQMVNADCEWFFLVGDLPAVPAIAANLERLSTDARGYVVLELPSLYDKRKLALPDGIQVHWLENHSSRPGESLLIKHVTALEWLPGRVGVWASAEYSVMKGLREYFFQERKLEKSDAYVSSYWKLGATDEEHKQAKRRDESATSD